MDIKEVNTGAGGLISDAIREMIQIAKDENCTAKQELNGVMVLVNIEGPVGPYPPSELTPAEKAKDANIAAAKQAKADARAKQARLEREQAIKSITAEIADFPTERDEEKWQVWVNANQDGYGGAVIAYAETWARLMQSGMAQGQLLEDIAKDTSRQADTDVITGFMYGAAVSVLKDCWVHGEALRRWHNLDTQIKDEGERANESGGVLNPALLNLG